MAMTIAPHRESGSSSSSGINKHMDAGKYVRYTAEQVEALERVYAECPKPSSMRRQQLIRECPILSNIEPKQIKVWFQNRRCREKQRKEASRLQTVNRKLTAMNKLLMEENDRLQKQVSQLVYENGYMRQQLQNVISVTMGLYLTLGSFMSMQFLVASSGRSSFFLHAVYSRDEDSINTLTSLERSNPVTNSQFPCIATSYCIRFIHVHAIPCCIFWSIFILFACC